MQDANSLKDESTYSDTTDTPQDLHSLSHLETTMEAEVLTENMNDLDATLRVDMSDPDATILRGAPLPNRLYLQAVENSHTRSDTFDAHTAPLNNEEEPEQSLKAPKKITRIRHGELAVQIVTIGCTICLTLICLLTGYEAFSRAHNPQISQAAKQEKARLDQLLSQAISAGTSPDSLKPIQQTEQKIEHSLPLFSVPFYLNPTQAYHTQAEQYKQLQVLVEKALSATIQHQKSQAQQQAQKEIQLFYQEVATWAKAHPYHDTFDNHNYSLNAGYMKQGIGTLLDRDLAGASTQSDFQTVAIEAENALFNLQMLEADNQDKTAYNHSHKTDQQLLEHYQLQNKQVLMVSLAGQAMRIYQNGQLKMAYQVVTGRQELPSLPGVWHVLDRKSPAIFTSGEPKESPYWFPDTPISYAILYHYGGYFIHDAYWRATLGPGAQFPHQDASGNTAYNFDGSHGCINVSKNAAEWIYQHTDWNTIIVIY